MRHPPVGRLGATSKTATDTHDTSVEDQDPHCLQPGEGATLLAGHPWRRFVVLGDSLAEGIGDSVTGYADTSWADRVASSLRSAAPDLVYLNLGKRDAKVATIRAEQLAPALEFRPDLAMVTCGANDAIHPGYRPDAIDNEIADVVGPLRAAGADVITLSLMIVSEYPAFSRQFWPGIARRLRLLGARTAALAERFGTIHCDLSGHPAGALANALNSADGLHPNRRCHAIGAAAVVRRLASHLTTLRQLDLRFMMGAVLTCLGV